MNIQKYSNIVHRALWAFLCLSLLASCAISFQIYRTYQNNERMLEELAVSETQKATRKLETYFEKFIPKIDTFEYRLSKGEIKKEQLLAEMENLLTQNQEVANFLVAFSPYKYRDDIQFYDPMISRVDGKLQLFNEAEDYTKPIPEYNWYSLPMKQGKMWLPPYVDLTNNKIICTYATPFYANLQDREQKQNPIGVINNDISYEQVQQTMAKLRLGKTGYGYIISETGKFIYHPIKEIVTHGIDIQELIKKPEYNYMQPLVDEMMQNPQKNSGRFALYDKVSEETQIRTYQSIPYTNWKLVTGFPEEEMEIDMVEVRHFYVYLIISLLLFFSCVAALGFKIYHLNEVEWGFGIVYSIITSLAMVSIWMTVTQFTPDEIDNWIKVFDKTSCTQFFNQVKESAQAKGIEPPVEIKTGLYIQSLDFSGPNDVNITGKIWQKIPKNCDTATMKGFIMPEAVSLQLTEHYRRYLKDSTLVIGWDFDAILRQSFVYQKYPFDFKDVWIRIWAPRLRRDMVLVPDIDSYEQMNPKALPGINKSIALSDWELKKSFFSFMKKEFETNFGLISNVSKQEFWELFYTIKIERNVVNPFISILLPFFVILILLFTLLLIIQETSIEAFVVAAGSLLFTVLLSHFSLRQGLHLKEIVYLEYFYFVLYLFIILLIINAFLFHSKHEIYYIKFEDNAFVKSVFWPLSMSILLIITVFIFY